MPRMVEPDGVGLEEIAAWLRAARSVVVLTGAGISTESGIPDFRGPQGVWTKDPKAEKLSNLHHYMNDPEVRVTSWQARLVHPAWTAEPNAGHRALAELERKGRVEVLVTQNIDGLHQRAGSSPSSPRTSTGCTSGRGTTRRWWWSSTARCGR